MKKFETSTKHFKNQVLKNVIISKGLRKFLKEIKELIRIGEDVVIGISGYEGTGKSALGIVLGFNLDKHFDLYDSISYIPDSDELIEKFNNIRDGGVNLIDEGVRALYKLDWQSKSQQNLNKIFMTDRFKNKIHIIIMPDFAELNKYFRNHRVRFLIQLIKKFPESDPPYVAGIICERDFKNPFAADKWHLKHWDKLISKEWGSTPLHQLTWGQAFRTYRKYKNFMTGFTFTKLPDEVFDHYEDYKKLSRVERDTKGIEDLENPLQKVVEKWKTRFIKLLYMVKYPPYKVPIKRIADELEVSRYIIPKWLKEYEISSNSGSVNGNDTIINNTYKKHKIFSPYTPYFNKVQKDKALAGGDGVERSPGDEND